MRERKGDGNPTERRKRLSEEEGERDRERDKRTGTRPFETDPSLMKEV